MLSGYIHRVTSVEINQDIRESEDSGTIEILIASEDSDKAFEFVIFFKGRAKNMRVEHDLDKTSGWKERENLMKITCEGDEDE